MDRKRPSLGTTLGGRIALKEQEWDVFLVTTFSSLLFLQKGNLLTFLNP